MSKIFTTVVKAVLSSPAVPKPRGSSDQGYRED
jgi:hypothetical protein